MKKKYGKKKRFSKGTRIALWTAAGVLAALVIFIVITVLVNGSRRKVYDAAFQEKETLLRETVVTGENADALKGAAGEAGYVIFLSVGNGEKRAYVFSGRGDTLQAAWQAASDSALEGVRQYLIDPLWLKADAVINTEPRTRQQIEKDLYNTLDCYYHYGLAFGGAFDLALTEAECNSAKIFNYDDNVISLKYVNRYLKETGRKTVSSLPENYLRFRTRGWICDGGQVWELSSEGLSYGRRIVDNVDGAYVKTLVKYDLDYLRSALHGDGKFDYAVLARFDNEIDWYNAARHAGTVWSMIQGYRLYPEEELKEAIDLALGYLSDQILYNGDAAYVYWENRDDIELGANAIALITYTEYADVFGVGDYTDLCAALARGILSMQNGETGGFNHVFNKDFTVQREFESVYYEGEAVYSLLKLYGLNRDESLLAAAKKHADRFIAEDYTRYKDHWISYTFNEITKYEEDPRYYAFGLKNAMESLSYIRERRTPAPTRIEQLLCSLELYGRALEKGVSTEGFDLAAVLDTLVVRTQRMLDGRMYPETAMHMTNPRRVVNSYMMRYLDYRVRIDDIQHNIGGSLKYINWYDRLVAWGMPTSAAAVDQGSQSGEGAEEPDEDEGDK